MRFKENERRKELFSKNLQHTFAQIAQEQDCSSSRPWEDKEVRKKRLREEGLKRRTMQQGAADSIGGIGGDGEDDVIDLGVILQGC